MKKEITTKDLKEFGLGLAVILIILGLVNLLKGHRNMFDLFFGLAAFAATVSLASPELLRRLYKGFLPVAHALGWINTRIILILVYYLVLTPTGLLMRLFCKDPMSRKIDVSVESYWTGRENRTVTKESLEKQF